MSLSVRRALRDGVPRAFTRNGLVLIAAYLLVSLLQGGLVWAITTTALPVSPGTVPAATGTAASGPAPGTSLPLSVSLQAALLGMFAGGLLTVPVGIVALRTFASEHERQVPDEFVFDRLGWTTLNTLAGSWLVTFAFLLPAVGCLLLGFRGLSVVDTDLLVLAGTLPGRALLLATATVCLLPAAFLGVSLIFVGQEIAIKRKNVARAIIDGWGVASGNRLRLLALALAPILFQGVLSYPLYTFLPPVTGQAAAIGLSGVVNIAVLATMARAYLMARNEHPASGAL